SEVAALGLGVAEPPSALQPLIAALGDAAPGVRAMAAWALGEIEDPAAIPALTNLLRDDRDPDVRKAAAWALGEISG
ncbi:MAG: HEAT repeat domain-containing protein, partial [Gemmatimonadaceae bacterium]